MSIVYVPDDELAQLHGIAYPIITSDILGIIDALAVLHCPPELLAELWEWARSPMLYEILERSD